jgi:hypothetical protein
VSLHLQTGADVAEEEGLRHGRAVPAAAEAVRATDSTTARTPRVVAVGVRGDDDGGGTDEAERRLVLLRMLLVRLFVLLLVLPVAVVAVRLLPLLLPQLPLRLQVVPLLLRELAGKTLFNWLV